MGRVLDFLGHGVAGAQVVEAGVVVLEALELVVRRLQRLVGHHQHVHALLQLDLGDLGALLVQQEGGHLDRHLHVHCGGVVLHGLFLNDPQDLQGARFGVADVARAAAAGAGDGGALAERWLQALAAHLHQAELADRAELHARAILAQRIAQAAFDLAAVLRLVHVDEVDDDQAAQVAQAHLPRHLVGGFEVGAGGGLFDVAALDGAGRVHVDRDQRLGVVDHDGAARGQLHGACVGRLDLVLDLEAAEEGRIVAVALHAGSMLGHDVRHELLRLFVDVVGVDEDVADVVIEVITDGADDQRRLLVDQEGTLAALGCAVDGGPQLEQVVQVPLQLGRRAADAGRARDDAHALRVLELVHRLLELGAVLALDAAAHTTAARVVGHQHDVAAGQADEGGEGGALVAALFLLDLNDDLLAFLDRVLDACRAGRHAVDEVLLGDFLERQEAVTVFAVVDEAGLERGLDARHDGLVDVALALFAPFDLDFVVEELLPVDDGQAALFGLRGVDQHPFHGSACPFVVSRHWPAKGPRCTDDAAKRRELPLHSGGWDWRGARAPPPVRGGQPCSRGGGGARMGARPISCCATIFLIAGCATTTGVAGDSMPVFAGVSQRRHI
ncbi:Uncharacterised protein [Xylophilus ampelinus]|nr:Uncharacterised protein [Xylophilus ampelinus]